MTFVDTVGQLLAALLAIVLVDQLFASYVSIVLHYVFGTNESTEADDESTQQEDGSETTPEEKYAKPHSRIGAARTDTLRPVKARGTRRVAEKTKRGA